MRFSKKIKRVMSLALAVAVVASSVTVPQAAKKAEAAGSYKGYMCFATGTWTFRNNHNDDKFSNKLQNDTNKLKKNSAKFTDVTMKKSKKAATYTVKLTGLKKGVISGDKTFNALYVDTNIPGKDLKKVTVTNVTLKIDGKTVKTMKKAVMTPDDPSSAGSDEFCQIQLINTWNSRVKKFSYKMPSKSIEISYTIKFK